MIQGGIAPGPWDYRGDVVDVFHMHFGIAGVWVNFVQLAYLRGGDRIPSGHRVECYLL